MEQLEIPMRFIDDHQLGLRPATPLQGLHACNLYGLIRIGHKMRRLHDADLVNTLPIESPDGLIDQFDRRYGERNPIVLSPSPVDDLRCDPCLARASRQLEHRTPITSLERRLEPINRLDLMIHERTNGLVRY